MTEYTDNIFTEVENSAWKIVFDFIKSDQKILDIGCSSGNLGAELIEKKNCTVHGVDISQDDISIAKGRLSKAWVFDIEAGNISSISDKYDTILLIDVIEHLKDPAKALTEVRKLLKKNGRIIFSIPNMAHTSVRMELLQGKFEYTRTGLLDYTHLHFYTGNFILKVFKQAGFSIRELSCTSVTYPATVLKKELSKVGLNYNPDFSRALHETSGDVYQYIGVAYASGKPQDISISLPKRNPHEKPFRDIDTMIKTLNKELKLKDNHIRNLQAQISELHSSINELRKSKVRKYFDKFLSSLNRNEK